MAKMNRKLCSYMKKKGKFNRVYCEFCSFEGKCISKHEDEHKFDGRRDAIAEAVTRDEDFTNPYELY